MRGPIKALAFAGAVSLGLVSVSCGGDTDTASTTMPAAVTTAPADAAPDASAPADTAAPADDGDTESLRIVSLSPTATEMVFAIGAGDLVVAVDDMSNHPAEALAVQTDLSGFTPNVEAIAAYEPDLVLHDGSTGLGDQLDGLGIANWVGAAATSFDDVYAQIEQLGEATGRQAEAADLVASMSAAIDAAIAAAPDVAEPLTFFHELDPTLYSITSNTFIGQVYATFGLRNIADAAEVSSDYPQLSAEFVIGENPDLIFLADTKCCGESAETVASRPGWDVITAVSSGAVVELDDDIVSRWGPRIVDFVETIAASLAAVAG